jgi:homoserine kinase type II
MSVYTTVTPEQLSLWLNRHNVGTLSDLRGISAGIENTNYFVTTTAGRYVLTLFEKLTAAELPFYLNLMAHLADHGIPSARPIPDLDGELLGELNGKPAALVSFLPGKDVDAPAAAHCAAVGAMLARIHRAGLSYAAHMENPRGLAWWQEVMPDIVTFLPAGEAALLKDEVAFHASHRFPDAPRGAIHADLFRDNALFEGERISGVIDFYFACTDSLLFDVAICVNDWWTPIARCAPSPKPKRMPGRSCCGRRRCASGSRGSTITTCRVRASSRMRKTPGISSASSSGTSRSRKRCRERLRSRL